MIQEYFMKKIQSVKEKIITMNVTLESQFNIYEDCFFANNDLKRKTINIYCYGSWAFFSICMIISCYATIQCSKFLSVPFEPSEKFFFIKLETALTILLIFCGPHFSCFNHFVREKEFVF